MSREPEVVITAYPDGPYLVRGAYRIVDEDGNEIGLTRRTVALCRCGRSGQKPWCDSSHKLSNFRTPAKTPRSSLPHKKDDPGGRPGLL
ncbi:MAG: CDGSH iron-sulfur domain-containing protein [Pseudonocardiales bacterium]|nr:CDGSH iron-sulfur domain-containing protein [Pseudonocardiales bacterium]MBV9029404.1 CDGSH iron-sulfur domain-containing protein [Pseudonocardiales bacterium]